MFLGKIIEERKEFLMRKGIAAEVLDEYPIVLGREDFNNILKGHRSEFCKPAFIAQKMSGKHFKSRDCTAYACFTG